MTYSIYKATNKVNGKSYIGFDSKWPCRQWSHKCAAFTNNSQLTFHRAIRKYGWDNFAWEVIHQSDDKEITLNEMERKFILEHDTFHNGYNMTFGGEGSFGVVVTQGRRDKIGKANSRSTLTNEGRKRKQEFSRLNNPMYREDVKTKHRERLLEVKPNAKKVTNGVKIYASVRDAHKDFPHMKYVTLWWKVNHYKDGWSYVEINTKRNKE